MAVFISIFGWFNLAVGVVFLGAYCWEWRDMVVKRKRFLVAISAAELEFTLHVSQTVQSDEFEKFNPEQQTFLTKMFTDSNSRLNYLIASGKLENSIVEGLNKLRDDAGNSERRFSGSGLRYAVGIGMAISIGFLCDFLLTKI